MNYTHSQDKDPEESWTDYWDRVRWKMHGDNCPCAACVVGRKEEADNGSN